MKNAVIFDLDGVLCSTNEYHYLAWKTIADGLKLEFDRKVDIALRGLSRAASLDYILNFNGVTMTDAEKEKLLLKKNEIYVGYIANIGDKDLMPGAKSLLSEIKSKGFSLAVGSSSKNAKFILERLDLIRFFDAVLDGNSVKNSKPDPEIYVKALDCIGKTSAEAIVLDDGEPGILAAKAAGITSVKFNPENGVTAADYTIARLGDLLKLIDKINACAGQQ